MVNLLFAAAIAAAPVPASLALPDADPAIWVVNDDDTVIYLFGTFHALDGRNAWFNDEIRTAFAASDELVLETVVPEPGSEAAGTPMTAERVHSLSVAPSASFLASTRVAISAGNSRGMNVGKGADMILRSAAEAWGKPVEGLESFDFQIGMFDRMGPQRPSIHSTPLQNAVGVEGLAEAMSAMQSAWNRGDQGIFMTMLNQMEATAPDSYRVMFAERNANWAQWIANRLHKPGTVFVAVGAGHLAGRDSVQAKLAERGVASARIN